MPHDFGQDIEQCVDVLRKGGLILYPTDTVWGIGCDATNDEAVKRVYRLKQRADNKALIVLLDSVEHLDHYVTAVPPIAYELLEAVVKPLTIIYDGAFNVSHHLLGIDDTIGIRVPQEPFTQRLCEHFGKPIVSTSANISGRATPMQFAEIEKEIVDGVDFVANYRRDDTALCEPSNVIMLRSDGTFRIIR